jgi:hypothetical protein
LRGFIFLSPKFRTTSWSCRKSFFVPTIGTSLQ